MRRAELNCCIFRHAVFKDTMQPIHPHAPREVCEKLVADGAVIGCAAPFRVVTQADGAFVAVPCEYI